MTREGKQSAQGQSALQLETHILPSRACSSSGPYSDGHVTRLLCSAAFSPLFVMCPKGQGGMVTGRVLSQPCTEDSVCAIPEDGVGFKERLLKQLPGQPRTMGP